MGGQRLRDQTDPVPGILGERKCLQRNWTPERAEAEQARDTAARQLAQAEQEGQAAAAAEVSP